MTSAAGEDSAAAIAAKKPAAPPPTMISFREGTGARSQNPFRLAKLLFVRLLGNVQMKNAQ
jgi:hypothetical protein